MSIISFKDGRTAEEVEIERLKYKIKALDFRLESISVDNVNLSVGIQKLGKYIEYLEEKNSELEKSNEYLRRKLYKVPSQHELLAENKRLKKEIKSLEKRNIELCHPENEYDPITVNIKHKHGVCIDYEALNAIKDDVECMFREETCLLHLKDYISEKEANSWNY